MRVMRQLRSVVCRAAVRAPAAAAVRAHDLQRVLRRHPAMSARHRASFLRLPRRAVRQLLDPDGACAAGLRRERLRWHLLGATSAAVRSCQLPQRLLRCNRQLPAGHRGKDMRYRRQRLPELRAARRRVHQPAVCPAGGRCCRVQRADLSCRVLRWPRQLPDERELYPVRSRRRRVSELRATGRAVLQGPMRIRARRRDLQRANLSDGLLRSIRDVLFGRLERRVRHPRQLVQDVPSRLAVQWPAVRCRLRRRGVQRPDVSDRVL